MLPIPARRAARACGKLNDKHRFWTWHGQSSVPFIKSTVSSCASLPLTGPYQSMTFHGPLQKHWPVLTSLRSLLSFCRTTKAPDVTQAWRYSKLYLKNFTLVVCPSHSHSFTTWISLHPKNRNLLKTCKFRNHVTSSQELTRSRFSSQSENIANIVTVKNIWKRAIYCSMVIGITCQQMFLGQSTYFLCMLLLIFQRQNMVLFHEMFSAYKIRL